jgi:predicted acylesterase/phospholipase RssA
VGDASTSPAPSRPERALLAKARQNTHTMLVLLQARGTTPSGTAQWTSQRRVDQVLHVHVGSSDEFARVARFMSGNAVGVVISGGAARSFAGIGLLRAMQELNIPIDCVGGVSAGALLSAYYARHGDIDRLTRDVRAFLLWSLRPDLTIPVVSVMRGGMIGYFQDSFGEMDIQDLPLPCLFVSANLTRAQQRVSRSGPVYRHLTASNALPGIMPPVAIDGDLHADGALLNNTPIKEVKDVVRGGPVIALDVTPSVEFEANPLMEHGTSGLRVMANWVRGKGAYANMPSVFGIMMRSQILHHVELMRNVQPLADLFLQPDVSSFSYADHRKYRQIAELGYQECRFAVGAWWSARQGG